MHGRKERLSPGRPNRALPPQRIDQLIHLVDEVLHLRLVVAAIGPLAEGAHAVAVVARLLEGIRDVAATCAAVACCWMSALSEVSCERISALEAGELFAGLVGSKGMAFQKTRGLGDWEMRRHFQRPLRER